MALASVSTPARNGVFVWGKNQIDSDITNNKFYMTDDHPIYVNKNAGASQVTEAGNTRYDPGAYTDDKIDITVGGIDPNIHYLTQ